MMFEHKIGVYGYEPYGRTGGCRIAALVLPVWACGCKPCGRRGRPACLPVCGDIYNADVGALPATPCVRSPQWLGLHVPLRFGHWLLHGRCRQRPYGRNEMVTHKHGKGQMSPQKGRHAGLPLRNGFYIGGRL